MCSRLIFKRLLMKLATELTFTFNNFCKQIDGCTLGGPLSVTMSDICMVEMETDVTPPLKPFLFSRHEDNIYNRCRKDEFNEVSHALNNYHENIN